MELWKARAPRLRFKTPSTTEDQYVPLSAFYLIHLAGWIILLARLADIRSLFFCFELPRIDLTSAFA